MVLHAYRKQASQKAKFERNLEEIRKTDPKAANLKNYDLIDLDNEALEGLGVTGQSAMKKLEAAAKAARPETK
eukprot:gene7853-9706_t